MAECTHDATLCQCQLDGALEDVMADLVAVRERYDALLGRATAAEARVAELEAPLERLLKTFDTVDLIDADVAVSISREDIDAAHAALGKP